MAAIMNSELVAELMGMIPDRGDFPVQVPLFTGGSGYDPVNLVLAFQKKDGSFNPLRIGESVLTISEIKNAGYDVFMILEATVGFNKREESGDQESKPSQPVGLAKWNSQDQAFLGAMKISLDE